MYFISRPIYPNLCAIIVELLAKLKELLGN